MKTVLVINAKNIDGFKFNAGGELVLELVENLDSDGRELEKALKGALGEVERARDALASRSAPAPAPAPEVSGGLDLAARVAQIRANTDNSPVAKLRLRFRPENRTHHAFWDVDFILESGDVVRNLCGEVWEDKKRDAVPVARELARLFEVELDIWTR